MFSTTQLDTLNGLAASMSKEGYRYYVAVTDNSRSDSSDPDLYIYFSKEKIYSTDYLKFHVPPNSLKYSIRTSNSSSYNSSSNYPRFSVSELELSQDVNIDELEFCSSNAEYSEAAYIQPDYIAGEVGTYEIQGAMLLTLCAFLLFMFFIKLFRR